MEMHPWRILLLEDDESEYALVREWLSSFGRGEYILQRATSSEIAFRILEAENVDAILADYEFEHKKGLDFARKGHLGLVGAAERAEAIGAQLNVESFPRKGTRLVVSVPCDTTQPE